MLVDKSPAISKGKRKIKVTEPDDEVSYLTPADNSY